LEPDLQVGEIFCRHGGSHEAVKILQQVFLTRLPEREAIDGAFDWSSVEDAFQEQAEIWKKMIAPRVKRTEKEAIQIMWDYAKVHGTAFDKQVSQCRDDIIALIRQGEEPDDAYELAAGHYRKGN